MTAGLRRGPHQTVAARHRSGLAHKIIRQRLALDLTQVEAAHVFSVHPITWAKWETGARIPRGLYADLVTDFLAMEAK